MTLKEKDGKKKINVFAKKMSLNDDERIWEIPLLLVDLLENDKKELQAQFATKEVGVSDVIFQKVDKDDYPHVFYEITDKSDNKKYYSDVSKFSDVIRTEDFDILGEIFSNPQFKCSYKVVNKNTGTGTCFIPFYLVNI